MRLLLADDHALVRRGMRALIDTQSAFTVVAEAADGVEAVALCEQHLPDVAVPTVFVHGARDPFGTVAELLEASTLIPAATALVEVPAAGHDLSRAKTDPSGEAVAAVLKLLEETL